MAQAAKKTTSPDAKAQSGSVFGKERSVKSPKIKLPKGLKLNARLKMDGLEFLAKLPKDSFPVAFFDPQYRGVLDKLGYGNEGESRSQQRCALRQMTEEDIGKFARAVADALIPSGHLFLWVDKFHLCSGFAKWLDSTGLEVVDLMTWHKDRMGMGYRTRRTSEYLVLLQKSPRRAKGVWKSHDIPDVWTEVVKRNGKHTHSKPVGLQAKLIEAVSNLGDIVLDPAAGSFSVMDACQSTGRDFLGCDLNG